MLYLYPTMQHSVMSTEFLNDRYCAKQYFVSNSLYWIVDAYICDRRIIDMKNGWDMKFFIRGGGNKIKSETKLEIKS